MTPTQTHVLVILLGTIILGAGVAVADIVTVDEQTGLTDETTIQEFEDTGSVTIEIPEIGATITISDTRSGVGLEGTRGEMTTTYLKITYPYDLEHSLRVYVPDDYFYPRVKQGLEPVESGPNLEIEPTEDDEYSVITVHLAGQTSATYSLGKQSGYVFQGRSEAYDLVNTSVGWELPSLFPRSNWEYLDKSRFRGSNVSVVLDGNPDELRVQYDDDPRPSEVAWVGVPACSDPLEQKMCQVTKNNQVVLFSTKTNPPQVRYREDQGALSTLGEWSTDLRRVPSRLRDLGESIFGGIL